MSGGIITGSDYIRERETRKQEAATAARRRARVDLARKAGKASGVRRHRLARGRRVPHARDRGQALALAYPIRQATQAEVHTAYELLCATLDIRVSERGFRTFYGEYVCEMTAYRAKGQDFQTTNAQRAAALASRGRPRCTRTIRRTRRRLEMAGLIAYAHVRRLGARNGYRDTLRVRVLSLKFCPPAFAAGTGQPSAACSVPALRQFSPGCAGQRSRSASPTGSAPPYGGRNHPPDRPAGNGSDEGVTRIRTDWTGAGGELMPLDEIRAELAAIEARLAAEAADG